MSVETAAAATPSTKQGLKIPGHLAVIMDGNGRWAKARGKVRTEGHVEGVKALRRLVDLSIRYGIKHLTVFSFSSENWRRPRDEVNFIFGLLHRFVASDLATLIQNNVRIRIIGSQQGLDEPLRRLIADVQDKTAANTGLELIVAFNYGGKDELTEATRRIAAEVAAGRLNVEDISEETVERALYTVGIPDPDLIIRTSGEQRVSNFLLWQGAYSELVFIDENWPDFSEQVFLRALDEYSSRSRRFGGIESRSP
ncbi:MAG: isoprenyl transferase [Devosia sp.]|uniref:isoprenyl transferase n=1 Tax=Devosia sp. TaxID=1871048 RepID=UPI001ACC49A7|nr:isoprenyl transferase [Devosia sp.]MBN9308399.1 isoprenyl transferase [Devosia sp.]MBN9314438.1 isoprenyl transferase [Devosia sp.]